MSEPTPFGGGQVDIVGLLRSLGGKPLQARLQETFAPAGGGSIEERTGRIVVSSRGWIRLDVQQGSLPAVTFAYDLPRRLIGGGISAAPYTWTWSPWSAGDRIESSPLPAPQMPPPEDAVLVEGIPCRLVEFHGDGTVTRELYAAELGIALRIETSGPEGARLFRLHEIRRDEPGAAEWPARQK